MSKIAKILENTLKVETILILLIFTLVGAGVYLNIKEQRAVDRSKIPEKVELSSGFQRWITNLKDKKLDFIDADQFRLGEENEIYNTKWMKVSSIEEPGKKEEFEKTLEENRNQKKVVFSLNDREFVDYRNIERYGYKANEVRFYGMQDEKIIDSKVVDCSIDANCYFDRAYFLDNNVFVISEFTRNIEGQPQPIEPCSVNETCTYIIKVHVIDLKENKRLEYNSKPFQLNLSQTIPSL